MIERLITNWVYGSALFALFLLVLAPLLLPAYPEAVFLVFLTLPIYMLHQWEEHDDDRFRLFVNSTIGKGKQVLTRLDVFFINVPVVWGVLTLSIWLTAIVNSGYGFIAVYLVLVNALVHILQAILMRRYNPGTITAATLFLPLGGYAWWLLHRSNHSLSYNLFGLVLAIAVHLAIILRVRINLSARASAQSSASTTTDRNPAPQPPPPSRPA